MDETTRFHLSPELDAEVRASLDEWAAGDKVMRLWARDATLWTGADEASWLGWLGVAGDQLARVGQLRDLADAVRTEGFTQVLVLGMGGSSLCPEVLKMTFGRNAGYPELFVLDSTDPGQIRAIERKSDLARTLHIVSSKSGSTLEPNIFMQYFLERARQSDPSGLPAQGRERGMPERFRLVKSGADCVLIHERTGQRFTLRDTTCSPLERG